MAISIDLGIGQIASILARKFPSEAEEQTAIDKALKAAQERDQALCNMHSPPEIMLSPDDVNWTCPRCGNTKYTGPPPMTAGYISLDFVEHGEQ